MARRTPADIDLIKKTYEETGSGRETARRLGLHDQTVYTVLRRLRGKCVRCKNEAATGKKYCRNCLKWVADRQARRRKERRTLGLCLYCEQRVDHPFSKTFCFQHRVENAEKDRAKRAAKGTRRRGSHQGTPTLKRREGHLRKTYGEGALAAWHRDGMACVTCKAHFGDKVVHMHHIDFDPANNIEENFVVLCFDCHRIVHILHDGVSAPGAVIAWMTMTYPEFAERWQASAPAALTPTGRSA